MLSNPLGPTCDRWAPCLIQQLGSRVRVEPTIVPDILRAGSGNQEVRTAMFLRRCLDTALVCKVPHSHRDDRLLRSG
jgi:hypothetical protein